jgi:hypothetical protein
LVPQQNPLTRITQVAQDLAVLADELESYVGPDAKAALLRWRRELLDSVDQLQRQALPTAGR